MEINGYPNYLIYKDGRVFSKKRKAARTGKFLKPYPDTDGYLQVDISTNKYIRYTARIHKLVAEHYIPNPDNKPTIDHIDRNRQNNDVSNLRWATRLEQGQNKGTYKNNMSKHRGLSYCNTHHRWQYKKNINYRVTKRTFKSKMDALCFKYIVLLKIKSRVI